MTDTAPAIQRLFRDRIMARSGQERLIMGAETFEAARQIILSSFPPHLSERQRREQLYRRIYNQELPNT